MLPQARTFQGPQRWNLSIDYSSDIDWTNIPTIHRPSTDCTEEREYERRDVVQVFAPERISLLGHAATANILDRPHEWDDACTTCKFLKPGNVSRSDFRAQAIRGVHSNLDPFRIRITICVCVFLNWCHILVCRRWTSVRHSVWPMAVVVLVERSLEPKRWKTVAAFAAACLMVYCIECRQWRNRDGDKTSNLMVTLRVAAACLAVTL